MNQSLQYVKERVQNSLKSLVLLGIVRNSQSRLSPLTPCGKNATMPRSARVSGPSSWSEGEVSEISAAVARLLFCSV